MAVCRWCKKPIVYIKVAGGRMTPVDVDKIRFTYRIGGKDHIVTGNGEMFYGDILPDGEETGFRAHECAESMKYRGK